MTAYLAAYDTEKDECLAAVRKIVEVHKKHEMPATFFLVARLLESQGDAYRELLGDDPLFEIACHTYTHMRLREHRLCGKPGPEEKHAYEVVESKRRIEDCFGRQVVGFRAPVSFCDGFRGALDLLRLLSQAGYRYSSSLAWGPDDSLPALIRDPFPYSDEGYPEIWEVPACGWHENVLKGHSRLAPKAMQIFPHPMPEAAPARFIETAEEEVNMNRVFLDKAAQTNARHVTLLWHPWSLDRFDPDMTMLDLTFQHVRKLGLPAMTFADHVGTL